MQAAEKGVGANVPAGAASRAGPPSARAGVMALVLAAGLCLVTASEAWALINKNYTPVELVYQSDQILHLELPPAGKARGQSLPARIVKAVKGSAPAALIVDLKHADELWADKLRKYLHAGRPTMALFFSGKYEGVKDDGLAGVSDEPPPAVALLKIGDVWFGLEKARNADAWGPRRDDLDMQAVWAGGTDMLLAAVRYIMTDPDPVVPVAVEVEWGKATRIATIDGKVHGIVPVDLSGRGEVGLFVLGESGDRVFQFDAGRKAFDDVTDELKLASKSKAAAWGDFNGDGRVDLASWRDGRLTLWTRAADGRFESRPIDVKVGGVCLGLSATGAAGSGRAGLLVSTSGAPVLLSPSGDGSFSATRLLPSAAGGLPGEKLGPAGPCLLADFDGDGFPDVLQPFAAGGLFYKGNPDATFEAPKSMGQAAVRAGEKHLDAFTGDYDADGLPDVFVTGDATCNLWANLGGGKFRETMGSAGAVPYISADKSSVGGTSCDINNDGRQDLLIVKGSMGPHIFFNRGFRSFGYAIELDLIHTELVPGAGGGQQAGTIADLNGDGAQDLALVLNNGQAWAVFRKVDEDTGPALGAQVVLPPGTRSAGPVNVTGWTGTRCLGARVVRCGLAGPMFGRYAPGPCKLKWRFPGCEAQEKQVNQITAIIVFQKQA